MGGGRSRGQRRNRTLEDEDSRNIIFIFEGLFIFAVLLAASVLLVNRLF